MAVTYGFYNALNHDRLYDAIQMSSIFDGIIQDGIFSTIGTSMIVTAPEDGMFVDVGPGRAWFNHTWTLNDTEYPVEAEEAEVVLDRIDAVILEVNSAAEVRANSIKFLKGTPSSNPVKPTLTHNAEVNQYALAYVTIRAGQTTIFQSDIENVVGTDETPFVTGLLQQVSVERLLLQWNDDFYRYFANFKTVSEADLLTWFNARKDEYDAWYADMEREGAEDLEEFDTWFQHMKDQLDEDAAGHLQAEIDELAEACEKGSVLTVTTEESALIGRTCTVSQGLNSINKQFDSNGVAEFPSVPYVGNIDIRATNGDQIAQSVLNIPYFGRYGVEIAFWAATLDIHSSVSELYGRTVTISKGGSVVGTTSFDNTGHAVFKVHEPGTYHISTSTAGGDTYTADVVVTEETAYNVDMGMPNGETVLPTDDIQIWLHCAGINNKDYLQTLSDVLGEPETYQALLSDMNACAYMARSTTFAGKGEGLVPTMTSNTTPSGTVVFSSEYNDSALKGYKAFDNDSSTRWCCSAVGSTITNEFIGYLFTEPKLIKAYSIDFSDSSVVSVTYNIEGYDGTNWIPIESNITNKHVSVGTLDNDTSYQGYRCFIQTATNTSSEYAGGNVIKLQFYANPEGITDDSQAMSLLGRYDYACEKLLANETWAEAIAGSEYFESVLDVKVPTMTSNTAPSGVASAGSEYGANWAAWKAFDNRASASDGSYWFTALSASISNCWLQYDFGEPVNVKKMTILNSYVSSNAKYFIKAFKIQGSNDGTAWTDLYSGTADKTKNETTGPDIHYLYDNDDYYRYYRIQAVSTWTSGACLIEELQFYGRHASNLTRYNPEVPVMTSNTTPEGELSASYEYSDGSGSWAAWKAFNKTSPCTGYPGNAQAWHGNSTVQSTEWIQYHFTEPKKIDAIEIQSYKTAPTSSSTMYNRLGSYKVQGSNDGSTWIDLTDTVTYGNTAIGSATTVGHYKSQVCASEICKINSAHAGESYEYIRVVCNHASNSDYAIGLAYLQFYTEYQGNVIHSAANDTVYYLNGNSPVTVCTTDANGVGEFDLDDLPKGSVTLYSTVAKDPNNLSNPYSKTVIVTGETTEIYLMPDNALYWYGWKSSDLEDCVSANGWSSNVIINGTPSYATNSVTVNNCGIGTKSMKTGLTTAKVLVSSCSGTYTSLAPHADAKYMSSADSGTRITTTGLQTLDLSNVTGNYYLYCFTYSGSSLTLSAFIFE